MSNATSFFPGRSKRRRTNSIPRELGLLGVIAGARGGREKARSQIAPSRRTCGDGDGLA